MLMSHIFEKPSKTGVQNTTKDGHDQNISGHFSDDNLCYHPEHTRTCPILKDKACTLYIVHCNAMCHQVIHIQCPVLMQN